MSNISLEWTDTLEEALRYARALCKLGYGVLIVPSTDGRCNVFYQPKV